MTAGRLLVARQNRAYRAVDRRCGGADGLVCTADDILEQLDTGLRGGGECAASATRQSAHGAVDRTGDSAALLGATGHITTSVCTTGAAAAAAIFTGVGHFYFNAAKKYAGGAGINPSFQLNNDEGSRDYSGPPRHCKSFC